MVIVPRRGWLARDPKSSVSLYAPDLKGVAVHYSGMDADRVSSHDECWARVRGIQRFHMVSRGWADVAYSFLVCSHGVIFEGRGWGARPASQGTNEGNSRYHSVCFLGGDVRGRDDVTDEGRRALVELIRWGQEKYPWATEVRPHSDFTGTSCPGDELRGFIEAAPWKLKRLWPKAIPQWFWTWLRWKQGWGEFEECGPANRQSRPADAPRVIPPWAWARRRSFLKARKK